MKRSSLLRHLKRLVNPGQKSAAEARLGSLIKTYRSHDRYQLDITVEPEKSMHVPGMLPSEPPEGITYHFGPSGFIKNGQETDRCVIPTQWWQINNYCHWTFSEMPLLGLCMESGYSEVVIPDRLLKARLPYQEQWLSLLYSLYPGVHLRPFSEFGEIPGGVIPVNHDTSSNRSLIGACEYRHYHQGRTTPYCIRLMESVKSKVVREHEGPEKIYILRKTRLLKNETEVRNKFKTQGFELIDPSNFTLTEQINMFASAKIVAGFHGAGLTNILFCGPKARILEIADANCVYPCFRDGKVIAGKKATRTYYHLAAHLKGLDYHVLESKDYHLNMVKLEEKLNHLK